MYASYSARSWSLAYLAALLTLLVLDGLWLGLVARDLYQREMGSLLRESPDMVPAAAFYLLYPAGLTYLVLSGRPAGWGTAVLRAAVVGFVAYGTYDATNLSVLEGFPAGLAVIDVLWGVFLTAVAGAALYRAALATSR
ncbi:DUF2177 family protein [Xylophilus sp. ASV27]|uniref:DUF2177 family protein n=1 Tax=Xylophilus sp. ASV27 TaxID=2795129 RepID=UPI0018ED2828|nr:DUF2177 family protein [Xylophilus sp. ASV27]